MASRVQDLVLPPPIGKAPRGTYRGGRGRYAPYRSNSVTFNSAVQPTAEAPSSATEPGKPSYVTRSDRHLQLVNTSVYGHSGHNSPASGRSVEDTKRHFLQRNARENAKLRSYIKTQATVTPSADPSHHKQYTIDVNGVKFIVANGGSKLVKADGVRERATPKMVLVGGIKFFRSKHGNLYRDAIVKAHRYVSTPRYIRPLISSTSSSHAHAAKSTEPCKAFSTTALSNRASYVAEAFRTWITRFFGCGLHPACHILPPAYILTRYLLGTCHKGPACRFVHDFSRVAVCKDFLQKGTCPYGDHCDLSHDLKTQRTPSCVHYAKGNCSNNDCRYAHSSASLGAPVCRPFGLYGYCDKGDACPDRHSFECPDFTNTGKCNIKGCKLLHRERASMLRKQQERQENSDYSDMSSDESSDFDSDVEELFHDDNASEFDLEQDMISV
ncbi:hypothetical protein TD95_005341 [Thielaviopsis punctulata]|uniref:C3H1-type domain-containing protein n=1 Tax=Thielaviopsis punctulata TaxID=72032 RepID=A0A0F4ZEX8_9PEZI|nr:hypothetical protein TD95_005341 [Thielaviopsis punctulata]